MCRIPILDCAATSGDARDEGAGTEKPRRRFLMSLPDPIEQPLFFAAMALRSKRAGGLREQDRRAFTSAISARAIYAEGQDVDKALRASPDFPGYLFRTVGERNVFVPFNLAGVFPGETRLLQVIETAHGVRLNVGHPLCISGSTTFLGRVSNVSDLDFCEYYLSEASTISSAVSSVAKNGGCPLLITVKCAKDSIAIPSDDLDQFLGKRLHHQVVHPPANTLKLDFIGLSSESGPLPVTNLVLPVMPGHLEEGNALFSFAYQEGVFDVSEPCRSLLGIQQFTTYVDWLRTQIEKWLRDPEPDEILKAPLKSLKRTLSLMLLLGYELDDDSSGHEVPNLAGATETRHDRLSFIISSLNDGTLGKVAEMVKLKELASWMDCCQRELPDEIVKQVRDAEPLDEEAMELALGAARELAEGFLALINLAFEEAEAYEEEAEAYENGPA